MKKLKKTSDGKYLIHPLCNIIRRPDEDEVRIMVESMKRDGWNGEAIVLDNEIEDCILDGWSRYEASLIANVEPMFRKYEPEKDGEHKEYFVDRKNCNRRMLNKEALIVTKLKLNKFIEENSIKEVKTMDNVSPQEKEMAVELIKNKINTKIAKEVRGCNPHMVKSIRKKREKPIEEIAEVIGVKPKRVEQCEKAAKLYEEGKLDPITKKQYEYVMNGKGRGKPSIKAVARKIENRELPSTKTYDKTTAEEMERICKGFMAYLEYRGYGINFPKGVLIYKKSK